MCSVAASTFGNFSWEAQAPLLTTNGRSQRICIWCGPIFALLFGAALITAGLIPPPSPSRTTESIAEIFRESSNRIRLGGIVLVFAAPLGLLWVSVISVQIKRIEGRYSPFAYTQMLAGAFGIVMVAVIPMIFLQAAAFRPETRPSEITEALSDTAWLLFIGTPSMAFVQNFVTGLAILFDNRSTPIFPRWLGYFNLWAGAMFLPAIILPFFKDGPFSWPGIFAFWFPVVVLGVWFLVMTWMLLDGVQRQEAEEGDRTQDDRRGQELNT